MGEKSFSLSVLDDKQDKEFPKNLRCSAGLLYT